MIKNKDNKILKDDKENNKNIIIEDKEEDILDAWTRKIIKYITIWIWIIVIILFFITNMFFNINTNQVWVTEWFFNKKIEVYDTSWIKVLNPFNLPKKTIYPLSLQSIQFSANLNNDSNVSNTTNNRNKLEIYNKTYKTNWLSVNTKEEINVIVSFWLTYRLKKDKDAIKQVYLNTGDGNFIEKIIVPSITSTISDFYSQYSLMDIVNKEKKNKEDQEEKNTLSIWTLLKARIADTLDKKWFTLENFTFSGMKTSNDIKKTIEQLFDTKNQLEIEKTKYKTLELKNKNKLKEFELTKNIYDNIKKSDINIDDYQKIKMVQIFENKWNGNLIPEWLNDLLK